jgi:hypothetical protein
VTLLSHFDPYEGYANQWRYIHTDGREYVALGTRFGTSIVRLTDPANPVEVGFFPGLGCTTRDVDQYQTYLYATGSSCGNTADPGLQIISMADPDHPVLVTEMHGILETAENITIDPVRGLLFAAEVNGRQGGSGFQILSLANPTSPTLLFADASYDAHDVFLDLTLAFIPPPRRSKWRSSSVRAVSSIFSIWRRLISRERNGMRLRRCSSVSKTVQTRKLLRQRGCHV